MTTPNFKKRTTVFLGAQRREKSVDSYKCLQQEVPCIFLWRSALWPGFDTFYFLVKLQRAFLISQESVASGLQPNPAAYQLHGVGRSKPQLLPCEMGVGGKMSIEPFVKKSQSNNWWNLFISCYLDEGSSIISGNQSRHIKEKEHITMILPHSTCHTIILSHKSFPEIHKKFPSVIW